MGLQIFEERKYFVGETILCSQCGGEHQVKKEENGKFTCGNCGRINRYTLDSFPETNVKSVLDNAYEMAGHRRQNGEFSA